LKQIEINRLKAYNRRISLKSDIQHLLSTTPVLTKIFFLVFGTILSFWQQFCQWKTWFWQSQCQICIAFGKK